MEWTLRGSHANFRWQSKNTTIGSKMIKRVRWQSKIVKEGSQAWAVESREHILTNILLITDGPCKQAWAIINIDIIEKGTDMWLYNHHWCEIVNSPKMCSPMTKKPCVWIIRWLLLWSLVNDQRKKHRNKETGMAMHGARKQAWLCMETGMAMHEWQEKIKSIL